MPDTHTHIHTSIYSAVLAIDVQALCDNMKVTMDEFAVAAMFAAQHTSLNISSDKPVAMVSGMLPPACKASRAMISAALHRKRYSDNAQLPMDMERSLLKEGLKCEDIRAITCKTYDELDIT